jgi:hypothetical protein
VKKVITNTMPFLLLVLALTFMTQNKQLDDLSDSERYQIQSYVKDAAESKTNTANADESDADKTYAAKNGKE